MINRETPSGTQQGRVIVELAFNGNGIFLNGGGYPQGYTNDTLFVGLKPPAIRDRFYWESHTFSHLSLTIIDQSPNVVCWLGANESGTMVVVSGG